MGGVIWQKSLVSQEVRGLPFCLSYKKWVTRKSPYLEAWKFLPKETVVRVAGKWVVSEIHKVAGVPQGAIELFVGFVVEEDRVRYVYHATDISHNLRYQLIASVNRRSGELTQITYNGEEVEFRVLDIPVDFGNLITEVTFDLDKFPFLQEDVLKMVTPGQVVWAGPGTVLAGIPFIHVDCDRLPDLFVEIMGMKARGEIRYLTSWFLTILRELPNDIAQIALDQLFAQLEWGMEKAKCKEVITKVYEYLVDLLI